MKAALQVLLQLRGENRLAQFAVGGAVAASFYIEAVATEGSKKWRPSFACASVRRR